MIRRSSRALILAAIAAVVAYAQCFNNCGFRPCEQEQSAPDNCHHEQPTDQQKAACSHQHSDFSSPEARISNDASPLLIVAEIPHQHQIFLETAPLIPIPASSPPGTRFVSSPSILRI